MRSLLTSLAIIAVAAGTPAQQERLSLEIEVRGEAGLYEPVLVWYTLRNDSATPHTVELGYDRIGNFTFLLQRPDGSLQRNTPVVRPRDHGARLRTLTLAPGESYRQHIVLNEWLRLDQAGVYSLRVELAGQAAGRFAIVGDAARQVRIRPANPNQIEARCKALLAVIVPVSRYDADFRSAVDELLWMRHPAAVPCLEEAIAAEVDPTLFDALVAIGTAEARNAVTRLTRHQTAWVANGAKSALARMK